MVRADRGRENFCSSINNIGALKNTSKMAGRCQGESTKFATFKTQAVEAANLRVFVGMLKGEAELKIFRSMLKYNNLFVAQTLSGNVIAFMGGRTLKVRPWIFKIPRDKPWAWPEIKFLSNPIEMQTHFSQEETVIPCGTPLVRQT